MKNDNKGLKKPLTFKLLYICLFTLFTFFTGCKEDSVNNHHNILPNPVAIDATPAWPQQGYNARHTGNQNGKFTNIYPVQSGIIAWVDTLSSSFENSSPELCIDANGNIYRMTTNFNGAHLYKIKPDGSIIWARDSSEIGMEGCAIALSGDETKIYYCNSLSFICRDSSGNFMWGLPTRVSGFTPIVGKDGTIYISIDDDLVAISPEGDIKWRLTGVNISFCSPAIDKEGYIYVFNQLVDNNYQLLKVDLNSNIIWRDSIYFPGYTSPTIDGANNIYVRSLNSLRSFTKNGIARWSRNFNLSSFPIFSPSINNLNQILSDSAGYMICLDSLGNTLWKTILPVSIYKQNYVLDGYDNIYLSYRDNGFISIISFDKNGNQRWQCLQQIPGEIGPGLVLSPQGNLYCVPKYSKKLYCIQ